MMKYKFHPFERAVGLFLGMTVLGAFFFLSTVAIKQNWFEKEVVYNTYVSNGSRIFDGSDVIYKGFKVGAIREIGFSEDDKIKLEFGIYKKYNHYMMEGTQLKVGMTILGEKSFEIVTPEAKTGLLAEHALIPAEESLDVMSKMKDEMIVKVDNILNNLDKTLSHTSVVSAEVEKHLPEVLRKAPDMTKDAAKVMTGVTKIVKQMNELQPLMTQLATKLPEGMEKAVSALEESIIVLRAMQKSYFLSSGAEEVRAEIKQEKHKKGIKEVNRAPASVEKDDDDDD